MSFEKSFIFIFSTVTPGSYTLLSTNPTTPLLVMGSTPINVTTSTQYPIHLAANSTTTNSQGCESFDVDLTGKVTVIRYVFMPAI